MEAPHWLAFLSRLSWFERQEDDVGSILAPCPCPGHSGKGIDHNPSLRAWLSDGGVVVLKCRTGCTTKEVLRALRLTFADLYPNEQQGRTILMSQAVYASILEFLSLAPRHNKDLLARGFTEAEITRAGYKTLTKDTLARLQEHLAKEFSPDELGLVPGFDEEGRLLQSFTGLLLPLRPPTSPAADSSTSSEHPYLLKSRKPTRPKYLVWASRHLVASPEAGYHWPSCNPPVPLAGISKLRIAEGEFKAELCALRTGVHTVSMPGVNRWDGVLDFVGPGVFPVVEGSEVILAFDWADVLEKRGIRRELLRAIDSFSEKGLVVSVESWDTKGTLKTKGKSVKGIDDALVAGREIVRLDRDKARDFILELEGDTGSKSLAPSVATKVAQEETMPFPLEVFPKEVAAWASQKAAMLACPVDYVAVPALVVAGRALGTFLNVELLQGWREYGNLYAVVVAEPSSTKSPAVDAAMSPLLELQKEYSEAHDLEVAEAELTAKFSKGKKGSKEVKLPDPPHLYVGDVTVERITEVLKSNKRAKARQDAALLYFRDEISGWVNSLNQYREGGADKEFYLSAWSGKEAKVDRCSKALSVYNFFFAVLGSTTPDMVSALATKGGKADGFFPRVLYSVPEASSFFRLPEKPLPFPAARVWDVVIRRLWLWRKQQTLKVPAGPYQLLKEHYDKQADAVDHGEIETGDDRSMMGKHRAYVLRLALIVHALRVAMDCSKTGKLAAANGLKPSLRPVEEMGCIEEEDVLAAIKLVEYFQSHYAKVKRMLIKGPEDRRINDFVKWAKGPGGGKVLPKDVYDACLFECRGKAEAIKLFKSAQDRGRGIVIDEAFYPKGK